LAVADLHHRFGERAALDGVSISAAPGEIVAVQSVTMPFSILLVVGYLLVYVLLVSIYITIRVAGRVYANALVRGGPRVSWKAALRLRPTSQ
jgi:hypothetical protein